MSQPFVGEIEIYAFNFAPSGWALCQGQLLPISQNTALFSLLGTYYGGNGTTNFALPNLQGCIPNHQGQGPGLSSYVLGQTGGTSTVTLNSNQIPAHGHTLPVSATHGAINNPANTTVLGATSSGLGPKKYAYTASSAANVSMGSQSGNTSGGSQAHNNMAPYVTFNYCIALRGVFPTRN